jgi:MoxR-like ATPase
MATQNPIEHHGTYPLPESQLDRFLMRLKIGYPSADSEKEILQNFAQSDPLANIRPVMTAAEVVEIQNQVRRVKVDEELVNYALAIVEKTRQHEYLSLGVSPRGSMSLYRAGQALAFLEGRNYCIPDDFKRLILPVFSHRCVVSSRYISTLKKSDQTEAILEGIIESTPVPL